MQFPDLRSAKMICLDLETFDPQLKQLGPGTFRGDGWPVGIALKPDDGPGFYVPIKHEHGGIGFSKAKDYLQEQLGTDIPKLGARLLYDLEWLHWLGVKVRGKKYDIQIAEPLLDENRFKYNLEDIAQRRLGVGKLKDDLLVKAQRINPRIRTHSDIFKVIYNMSPDDVAPYAIQDTELPFQIFQQQYKEIEEQGLLEVFNLETDLVDLLLEMRIRGVPVNIQRAEQVGVELDKKAEDLQAKLDYIAKGHVDIWAADSISKAFDRLGIAYPRTAKTKAPSFTAPWLTMHTSDLAQTLLQVRKVRKMKNDFIDHMVIRSAINGRIHPQFHSVKHDDGGTVSGRFASSNPNLQQVPARDPVYGPLIRSLFVPEQGCLWCKCDYGQQEPRVTVHYAYLKGFQGAAAAVQRYLDNPDTDYHQMVADMCGIERKPAKNINLGLAYGMGIEKMAAELGKTVAETRELYKKYHAGVPFVQELAKNCMQVATTRGYIKTLLGRRRRFDLYLPTDYDKNNPVPPLRYNEAVTAYGLPLRRAFTHKALNSLIQGSSADMIKKAMVNMFKAGYVSHITVHDETDTSVNDEKQAQEIKDIMLSAVKLVVPLKVDMFLEANWGDCK